MLVGLAGLLSGYNGHFEFKSGEEYNDNVPYVAMRVMMAIFGVALVPLGWYTAVELGMSSWACHLVALMVLCGERQISYLQGAGASCSACRCCLVVHIAFHPAGFNAPLLHFHHGLFPDKISQSTVPVCVSQFSATT